MSEATNEHGRAADRYAAELLDKLGVPTTREEAATAIALAYLDGAIVQLTWVRENEARSAERLRQLHAVKS